MTLITCQNVTFAYEGAPVITDLDFEVNSGDYLCIVGENGTGKTTLMKGLLHLKEPSSGNIVMSEGLRANEIGYLPQQTQIQKDFPASVYEVVLSGSLNRLGPKPFYGKVERARTANCLTRIGIWDIKDRCYRELSGGQQQRVLLARALAATSKLLLLDEPAAGLDPIVTLELYKLVQDMNRDLGITVVMISHDIQSATNFASHILHLHNKQLFFGTSEDYKASPVGRQFLGGESYV